METSTLTAPAQTFDTPAWVQDAVFYQIFPDRFAQSHRVPKPSNLEPWDSPPTVHGFKGGDLLGIAERLDYLQDLGISALYLTPVFTSAANHRYHTHDYYQVDPLLGGNEALDALLGEAHRRGMRVILDGVFNHASRGFYQFSSILENGEQSPYVDWFSVYSWPLNPYGTGEQPPGYACWWNLPALPKFNTATPAVREFLWGVGEHWIRRGVDGWRLDVPNEIDDDAFWREFRRRVKQANPDAYIVGEIWGDARRWLAGDQFDAVMNYLFTKACLGFFAGRGVRDDLLVGTGLFPVESLDAEAFGAAIGALLRLYPWSATLSQLNLLGSHDTPRFLTLAGEDASSLRLATLFQMTYPGAPCLYYGDEIGMLGGRDPDCRRSFPWIESAWDRELQAYVRRCIGLRHAYPALRRGEFRSIQARGRCYVYARRLGEEMVLVALNAGQEAATIDLELPADMPIGDLSSPWNEPVPHVTARRLTSWHVPARSGAVLCCRALNT